MLFPQPSQWDKRAYLSDLVSRDLQKKLFPSFVYCCIIQNFKILLTQLKHLNMVLGFFSPPILIKYFLILAIKITKRPTITTPTSHPFWFLHFAVDFKITDGLTRIRLVHDSKCDQMQGRSCKLRSGSSHRV